MGIIEKVKKLYNDTKNSEVVRNIQNAIMDDEDFSSKLDILNKIKEYETIIIHGKPIANSQLSAPAASAHRTCEKY